LYDLYTAFVTVSVLAFIAIYNTSFITVVTLGGTVLGSAVIGLCSALFAFVLRKLLHIKLARYVLEVIGCGCIIGVTAACLPGWEITADVATVLFLLVLCFLITAVNEYVTVEH
jgi:hypothetical protein